MSIPTIFESCELREDVEAGILRETEFAADLAQVLNQSASIDYTDPATFFANTYPTEGLQEILRSVFQRLVGKTAVNSIFRLDTSFGGGKTHALIALAHIAKNWRELSNLDEFLTGALVPSEEVQVATFDGENADPANGRPLCEGIKAHTPWGEIAYGLGGPEGFERVSISDSKGVAPGTDTIVGLFNKKPTLILLDELAVYLRKVRRSDQYDAEQFTAFLSSLIKAVEQTPRVALVLTVAMGRLSYTMDAYEEETQHLVDVLGQAESILARKATILDPTRDEETVHVLKRRLFKKIDETRLDEIVESYAAIWQVDSNPLPSGLHVNELRNEFKDCYPFHPSVLHTLTSKTGTLSNFQRVRGMLRLLAQSLATCWKQRPEDATAFHLHHIDLKEPAIKAELVTRLGQQAFVPALNYDIAGTDGLVSLAERIDRKEFVNAAPYTSYLTRTTFIHTLAFPEQLKGLSKEELGFSMLNPSLDMAFINNATQRFQMESAYLDDRPGAPLRFVAEANLNQIIRGEEQHISAEEVRVELERAIHDTFDGNTLELIQFPVGAYDVPDDIQQVNPKLALIGYSASTIGSVVENVPDLVKNIYEKSGTEGKSMRLYRNNLMFLLAENGRVQNMLDQSRRHLALAELRKPERADSLADHQRRKVNELFQTSKTDQAVAIQSCYRHLFYPSGESLGDSGIHLTHTSWEITNSSHQPGNGQQQIVRRLREQNQKLRMPDDEPDSPSFIQDRTELRKGVISTAKLRNEFRKNPKLSMLIGDDVFIKSIHLGVDSGRWIYKSGSMIYAKDQPKVNVSIDEQSFVYTAERAKALEIWPRAEEGRDGPVDRPVTPPPPGPVVDSFIAKGLIVDAFNRVWHQLEDAEVEDISRLTISVFDLAQAVRLFSNVRGIPSAAIHVDFKAMLESGEDTHLDFSFEGLISKGELLTEYMNNQSKEWDGPMEMYANFETEFTDGYRISKDNKERLLNRLSRHMTAEVEIKVER